MRINQLGDQIARYLSNARVGVLSVAGAAPIPVRYQSQGLAVVCFVPRWADATYILEERLMVTMIVLDAGDAMCWLQYQGWGRVVDRTDGDDFLQPDRRPLPAGYRKVALQPSRLDLFDERLGWGARETLEL